MGWVSVTENERVMVARPVSVGYHVLVLGRDGLVVIGGDFVLGGELLIVMERDKVLVRVHRGPLHPFRHTHPQEG